MSVCLFRCAHARVSCSVIVKLPVAAGGPGGQVIAGLTAPVLRFAESYQCISAMSFADQRPCQNIVPVDIRFLPDLIDCRPTFEFKPTIIILAVAVTCMVAEGIGGQASRAP